MLLSLAAPVTLTLFLLIGFGSKWVSVFLIIGAGFTGSAALAIRVWCITSLPKKRKGTFAFFHPAANGGGGGERVLWCAIDAIQTFAPQAQIILYSGDGLTAEQLLQNAASNFNITVTDRFQVIPLQKGYLVQPEQYPHLTLLGQALGALKLGHEALSYAVPEVFIDTTGWASTYPLARLAGSKVVAYTHYPTVSIVNSTWTANHIRQLWWRWGAPVCVFPPCTTDTFQKLPLDRKLKRLYLVSVAQFRPEKNHELQLKAFALARQWAQQDNADNAVLACQLKVVGGCHRPAEKARLAMLRQLAQELRLADCVEFCPNASYEDISSLLGGAVGGLHTMLDEHFGISIVEYMAAGAVPIVHDSGGPRADIVRPELTAAGSQITGYCCTSVEQYAEAITSVVCMDQQKRLTIAAAARRRASHFSDQLFQERFLHAVRPVMM